MNINPASYLKNRMLQNANMFLVWIPRVPTQVSTLGVGAISGSWNPAITSGSELMFLTRSTSIPGKTSEKEIVKTFDSRFVVPHRPEYDHEWSIKMIMTEDHAMYDLIINWYKLSLSATQSFYADAYVFLLDYNYNPKNCIQFRNVFPSEIPSIEDLNNDGTDELLEITALFAYDDICYNEDGSLNSHMKTITPNFIENLVAAQKKI